jgi:hypothetical protein
MTSSRFLPLLVLLLCGTAYAQGAAANTLEGFWQDTARRILYSRAAPPAYVYGEWTAIDQGQTYPAAKQVKRSGPRWNVVDLNFDDSDYVVQTIAASEKRLEFVRTVKWSGCAMHHTCSLSGNEMVCALENVCPENDRSVVDWRGEERYARRVSCERLGRVQLQGFPVACR